MERSMFKKIFGVAVLLIPSLLFAAFGYLGYISDKNMLVGLGLSAIRIVLTYIISYSFIFRKNLRMLCINL